MHECSSAPSSASDIRIVSSSNLNLSISCSREEEKAVPFPIIASPSGTCCNGWVARGIPCGIGDRRAEDRTEQGNLAERRLYVPNGDRLFG